VLRAAAGGVCPVQSFGLVPVLQSAQRVIGSLPDLLENGLDRAHRFNSSCFGLPWEFSQEFHENSRNDRFHVFARTLFVGTEWMQAHQLGESRSEGRPRLRAPKRSARPTPLPSRQLTQNPTKRPANPRCRRLTATRES
jgi:hypothetical protein